MHPENERECLILAGDADGTAGEVIGALKPRLSVTACRARDEYEGLECLRSACKHSAGDIHAVVAFGAMCRAALALAILRSVRRVVLVGGGDAHPLLGRGRDRLGRFVRGNLALCTADVLCVDPARGDVRALRRRMGGSCLVLCGEGRADGWPECEFSVKNAICAFLLTRDPGKSLAESHEMCIIYR